MATASYISRLSQAVDQIEKRFKQNRPLKVIKVRRRREEDRDAAKDRHFAAHPEDRGADVVIFAICDDEDVAAESRAGIKQRQPLRPFNSPTAIAAWALLSRDMDNPNGDRVLSAALQAVDKSKSGSENRP